MDNFCLFDVEKKTGIQINLKKIKWFKELKKICPEIIQRESMQDIPEQISASKVQFQKTTLKWEGGRTTIRGGVHLRASQVRVFVRLMYVQSDVLIKQAPSMKL